MPTSVEADHGDRSVPNNCASMSSEAKESNVFNVPWGYYYFSERAVPKIGTKSLASCFAYLRHWATGLFFSHVSNDCETGHLLSNLGHSGSSPWPGMRCAIIVGKHPSLSTWKRVNSVLSATYRPHLLVQAPEGEVVYRTGSNQLVAAGYDVVDSRDYSDGMSKSLSERLLPMDESPFVLDSDEIRPLIGKTVLPPKLVKEVTVKRRKSLTSLGI